MEGDSLWIDVTELMQKGNTGVGEVITRLNQQAAAMAKLAEYVGRLGRLLGILDIDLRIEEVTGTDKSLEVMADIFNQVNSRGTKLSNGDLAFGKDVR